MTSTLAVVTDGDGTSRLSSVDIAAPGPGELVLALEGCGLCGTDLFKIQQRRAQERRTQPVDSGQPSLVLGHELVGSVESVGPGLDIAKGQRLVVAHHVPCGRCRLCRSGAETNCESYRENLLVPGGFAEQILVRERAVQNSAFPVPDAMTTEQAIFLEPTACVLRGINKAALPEEPRVAIFGCGSMGLLHLLVLRACYPEVFVECFDLDQGRCDLARELGADGASTRPESSGKKELVDAAFDTVGTPEVLEVGLDRLRPGGRFVFFAHGASDQKNAFDSNRLFRSEHQLLATYSSGRADQVYAFELLCSGRLDPSRLVTHRLSLSDFNAAVALAEGRQALKVLLTP